MILLCSRGWEQDGQALSPACSLHLQGLGRGWLGAGALNAVGPGLAPGEQCARVRIQTEV